MLDVTQFRELIVEPTLEDLGMYSSAAVALVLGTGIQESRLTYLKQLGNGPALGLFQMEPNTHNDIWANYIRYRQRLADQLMLMANVPNPPARLMVSHLSYACAMCRVHYRRVPEPLPPVDDPHLQARYWKRYYNTSLGKGTEEEYVRNWYAAHDRA